MVLDLGISQIFLSFIQFIIGCVTSLKSLSLSFNIYKNRTNFTSSMIKWNNEETQRKMPIHRFSTSFLLDPQVIKDLIKSSIILSMVFSLLYLELFFPYLNALNINFPSKLPCPFHAISNKIFKVAIEDILM